MAFAVRRLGAQDVAPARDWLRMFGRVFDEPENYAGAQPDDAYLAALLGDAGFLALAAEAEGAVIGGLAAYVLRKFEQPRAEVFVYDLAVEARWRRRGVATALLEETQATAADVGAHVVFIQADRGDEPADALYSRLGRREEALHFDLPPRPRRDAGRAGPTRGQIG